MSPQRQVVLTMQRQIHKIEMCCHITDCPVPIRSGIMAPLTVISQRILIRIMNGENLVNNIPNFSDRKAFPIGNCVITVFTLLLTWFSTKNRNENAFSSIILCTIPWCLETSG